MKLTGVVTAKTRDPSGDWVEIEIRGRNGLGDHVTGSVQIALAGEG